MSAARIRPSFSARLAALAGPGVTALLLTCGGAALAQAPVAPPAAVPATAPPTAVERTVNPGDKQIEQKVEHIHHEDAGSRVDELRVGGQTKSITVQPKTANVPQYHITPSVGARQQPSQRDGVEADGTQRTWRVLGF